MTLRIYLTSRVLVEESDTILLDERRLYKHKLFVGSAKHSN
jgi:hypothetical protein